MEKTCRVLLTEIYGKVPVSSVIQEGQEVHFLHPHKDERERLNFLTGKVKKANEFGVKVERNYGGITSYHFIERNAIFILTTVVVSEPQETKKTVEVIRLNKRF